MTRVFRLCVMMIALLALSNLSWAQCPEDETDLGECDTLNVVPWPETDTCFIGCNASGCDTICINNPGEDFPRFLFVPIMVTHDSNTFWWESESKWVQDSIAAFVVPLGWERTNPAKYCSLSASFNDAVGGNMNPYSPYFRRSIFRHFHPEALDSNRMAVLASYFGGYEWSTIVALTESDSSWYYFGDDSVFTPPHMWLSMIPTAPSNRRWWEGDRTLLATLTFTVEDTMHICIDSMFWPPSSKLSYTRMDAKVYQARHNLPQCIWVGPPRIEVTSPNGGETLLVGSIHDITWISEGFGDNVDIEYSTNGGTDWTPIISNTDNDGLHPWTVPNTPSTECRVRVSDEADGDPSDMSDANFTIGSANAPPVVADIPNQTIAEGDSFLWINLDDYVDDPDNSDDEMTWTHFGNSELLVDITDRVARISLPDPEWNGAETIWFKACDPGALCDSNEATFTVTAVNDTPVVADIPNQTIAEGDTFLWINLDNYVTDADDHDSVMIWTYFGNSELLVDITDRIARISLPDPEWNGAETIWFKACDPGALCDSNEALFTVTAENDTPVVADIPNQTIAEGDSFLWINLDDYVEDPDNSDDEMTWTYWGNSELLVDITDRVARISVPDPEWNGAETIWFKACDPGALCDSNEALFTVTAENDTPVVADIPNQTIAEGDSFLWINLDDYVEDPDNADDEMNWTYFGNSELLVDITDRVARISLPDPGWNGSETIWFKACDPGALCDSNEATFTVTAENDPPVVADIPNQTIAEGDTFLWINLDDYVEDPDNADDEMSWTYFGNSELLVDITDRVARISVPDPEWNGAETIWFKACDPGALCDSNEATFTVTAVNDTPVVADIPSQTIAEGDTFLWINLDDYVDDPDNADDEMSWTYFGNSELLVDITDRVARISVPDPEWNGAETIWFKACDPGALCDSNEATFTVTAENDTPVVADIPNQTIAEGDTFLWINLDDYVDDPDNSDDQMTWTYWGNSELLVDITDRVARISLPDPGWNGSETIWFKACDPGALCDSNEATFTVTAENDPPVVADIPNQTIAEGDTFLWINLDDYVEDPDNSDDEMIWTYFGNSELLVDITDRVARISVPDPEWNGAETIWFKACDPVGLCDSNEATFTVTGVNDPPVVADIPNQTIAVGDTFLWISLDNYVEDPDNADDEMTWTYFGNSELLVDITDRVARITLPDPGWSGSETIWFKACDPGALCDSNEAIFTVEAEPIIGLDPESLFFTAEEGGANPDPQVLMVTNEGTGTLTFTAENYLPWLDLMPDSGTAPLGVTTSVDILGLTEGMYYDTITVSSPEAANSPQLALVTLEITPPAAEESLAVTAPNGGEVWCVDDVENITWTSSAIDSVFILYSSDGGANWSTIVGATQAVPGTYAWTVPNTPSHTCLVRICDVEDGTPCDESDAVFTISTPPPAPPECSASDDSCDRIRFCWQAVPDTAKGYNIYRDGTFIGSVGPDVTCYDDAAAVPGTSYEYCVAAYNDCGESGRCCDEGTRLAPPLAPTDCAASDTLCDLVRFCWKDNSDNESGFNIYRDSVHIGSVAPDVNCFDDGTAAPGVTYEYCVKAFNDCGESEPCCDSGTVLVPPAAPTNCVASDNLPDKVRFCWQDNSDDEVGFIITRDAAYIASVGPDVECWDDTSAVFGETYFYCVRSHNRCGKSEPCCDSGSLGEELFGVELDIKPRSCPNPLNTNSKGVLPVAILGTEDFDVMTVDPAMVMLEGVPRLRWSYEDVSTPVDPRYDTCDCTTEGGDGYMDMTLKFDRQAIVVALGIVEDGETRVLTLTGMTYDGIPIQGQDCVIIKDKGPSKSSDGAPDQFTLGDAHPNPFNPACEIGYAIPTDCHVTLSVYNMLGQKVRILVDEYQSAGHRAVEWNGKNDQGQDVTSGVYFYRIQAGDFAQSKRMVLLK